MAGDWIKMRTDLYRDPKVLLIADALMRPDSPLAAYVNQNMQCDMIVTRNVMRNVTVGALVSVWGILRKQGLRIDDDLVVENVTHLIIDDISDLDGFGKAMIESGWLRETDLGLVFPKFFEDNNVDPREAELKKNRERQQRYRDKKRNVTHNVTVTQKITLEEKRREENIKNTGKAGSGFLSKIKPEMVASPVAILGWFDRMIASGADLLPAGTPSEINLVGTAQRIHSDGRVKNKVGALVSCIKKQDFRFSDGLDDWAAETVKEIRNRKSNGVPVSAIVAQAVCSLDAKGITDAEILADSPRDCMVEDAGG